METIKTNILPTSHNYVIKAQVPSAFNYKAICIFVATGFFMDDDTFLTNKKCLLPGHIHNFDDEGFLKDSQRWFNWHHTPKFNTFDDALEAYIALFTDIVKDQIGNSPVILPLSGGLDSRSQAMVLKDFDNQVHSYSYYFQGGYPEHQIAKKIANFCGFDFQAFGIPKGYLWEAIDELANINRCYSEFTHARQMGVFKELKSMDGVFSLGHWGDVFFDKGCPEDTKPSEAIGLLLKKMIKPGGMHLANLLWEAWELEGDFKDYFIARIENAYENIQIENLSAKIRAFKTSQWAHRWTTTNLSVFNAANPITLPYYDNRMCEFVCSVPEEYLANRRLQIAHIKQCKSLAEITWQAQRPFNLNNYHLNKTPYNLPYRISNKLKRETSPLMGKPFIQRNFELQFLGDQNDKQLKQRLFSKEFKEFVPEAVTKDIYDKFVENDPVFYSHPTSLLLTLSLWNQHFNN